jgi:hypothetical protein
MYIKAACRNDTIYNNIINSNINIDGVCTCLASNMDRDIVDHAQRMGNPRLVL